MFTRQMLLGVVPMFECCAYLLNRVMSIKKPSPQRMASKVKHKKTTKSIRFFRQTHGLHVASPLLLSKCVRCAHYPRPPQSTNPSPLPHVADGSEWAGGQDIRGRCMPRVRDQRVASIDRSRLTDGRVNLSQKHGRREGG